MYLAFFPFSEAVCLISVILTWMYFALSIIGSCQASDLAKVEENLAYRNQIHFTEINSVVFQGCYCFQSEVVWNNNVSGIAIEDHHCYFPVVLIENKEFQISFQSIFVYRFLPDRAPPALS